MRKVLVTGGAGFIGSNLCEALLERGDWVVCLDNFSTGHMENLIPLISRYPDSFRLIVGDIRNFDDCLRAVEGVDYVLHEAALGSVPRSVKDPVTTNEVNIGVEFVHVFGDSIWGERLSDDILYLRQRFRIAIGR